MIRINLLTGERRATTAAARVMDAGQKAAVAGVIILLMTTVGIAWRYWDLSSTQATLAADIAEARREETRLTELLKQVADFDSQRGQLQQRVALIDELRMGQSAPVHLIDQISRALPEMTWLTTLRQNGHDVTISGRCVSLTALSDFVGNLAATGYFARPVEIVSTGIVSSREPGAPEVIEFTIKATFQMAGLAAPAATPARRAARGGNGG
jgi:type IV pilus assembly protein PilN